MPTATPFPGRATLGRLKRRLLGRATPAPAPAPAPPRHPRDLEADAKVAAGEPIVRTPVDGIDLWVDLRDGGVGRPMFRTGAYESAERALMERTVKPGTTFVDVGANIGYMTLLASRLVGDAGRVFAFEPHPGNRDLLERNLADHAPGNVDLFPVALGEEAGSLTMHCSPNNFGDHRTYAALEQGERERIRVDVEVRTMDATLPAGSTVDFMKIDVQGFETYVVAGADRVFRENPGMTLLMEYWPYGLESAGGDGEGLLARLAGYGLEPALLRPDGTAEATSVEALRAHPRLDPGRVWNDRWVNLVLRRPAG